MAIHYSQCKNEQDVSNLFKMTLEASLYAYNDYRRWHRNIIYYKMSNIDSSLYQHFYNETEKKFIYQIQQCTYCDDIIYNSNSLICNKFVLLT